MCATPDKAATEEFRNRTGPQRAYKVINQRTARPFMFFQSGVPYHPGRNVDRRAVKTYLGYKRGATRGFHCYLSRKVAVDCCRSIPTFTVVCVTFDPADVIAAETTHETYAGVRVHRHNRQIVVRALHISERAWKQAGLPANGKGGGA